MDRVSLTQKLRKQHGDEAIEAQTRGDDHPDWPTWVKQQGYDLDPDGLVQTAKDKVTEALVKKK